MASSMRGAVTDEDYNLGVPYTLYAREYVQICYINEQRMIDQDAYLMRGTYVDEQGHTFKVQLPVEDMWVFHTQDKHTRMLLAAINLDGYFELPPWGYDIQRAHQVLFNYNDNDQTTSVVDLQGKVVRFKLDSQLVREALGLRHCQKQFMGSNLRAEEKKECFQLKSKNFTFSDILIEEIKLAAELMMQHFHFAIPNRFTKPRIQFVRILADAHRKMSEKMDFAPWILRELLASRTYNPVRGRYLAAVPALTRIAYLGIGAISQLPEPLRIIKGIPKSLRAIRGISQKRRQSLGDSSDEEQTTDLHEHDSPACDEEEQGKEDQSVIRRTKRISNLIQETHVCLEEDASRCSRRSRCKLTEEEPKSPEYQQSPPVDVTKCPISKEMNSIEGDSLLKGMSVTHECTLMWDNKMKDRDTPQVATLKDIVMEPKTVKDRWSEESQEEEHGSVVKDHEKEPTTLAVLIEANAEKEAEPTGEHPLQTARVTQEKAEKNVHKRKLEETDMEESLSAIKLIKGDEMTFEHADEDEESRTARTQLPLLLQKPQTGAFSSQESHASITKEEMEKKVQEFKEAATRFAQLQAIEEQKKELLEDGQLDEKQRNSAAVHMARRAIDAIKDLGVDDQISYFSEEYMTSMYNNLHVQLLKTQMVQMMREAAQIKNVDLLSEALHDSIEKMAVKNHRINELETELEKLQNHQLDLQVKATQMEVHLLQSLNLERLMSIKEHLVEEKNNEIKRLSDRLEECERQLLQAEQLAMDATEDAKRAQSKLQEERQLRLQTIRSQPLSVVASLSASVDAKELQRLQFQLQRAEKLRAQQEADMSELYMQNTQLHTTLADLRSEVQSLKASMIVLPVKEDRASRAIKNDKESVPIAAPTIEDKSKAPMADLPPLIQSTKPQVDFEMEGNELVQTHTEPEELYPDGEDSAPHDTLQHRIQETPKMDAEHVCCVHHLFTPKPSNQHYMLNFQMMRAYVEGITGAWANQHPKVIRGGFSPVDPLNWQTEYVMAVQPEWRKTWLQKHPHTIHIYAKAPRAVRTDPNYCPVQRRSTWKAHEEKLKVNPSALNYPVLPEPEHGEDLNEEWFLRTCEQQITIFEEANDVACLMLCKILNMLQTCIKTFKDIKHHAAWRRFDHPISGLAFRFSLFPSEEQLHGYFARLQYLPSHYMKTFEEAMDTEFFHGGCSSVFASHQSALQSRYLAHQAQIRALALPPRVISREQGRRLHRFQCAVNIAAQRRRAPEQLGTSLLLPCNCRCPRNHINPMKATNLGKGAIGSKYRANKLQRKQQRAKR